MIVKIAVSFLASILIFVASTRGVTLSVVEQVFAKELPGLETTPVVNKPAIKIQNAEAVQTKEILVEQLSGVGSVPLHRPLIGTTGPYVNIRACPYVDNVLCPPIRLLGPGNTAEVIGKDLQTGWWNISFDGKIGWITNAPALVWVKGDVSLVPIVQAPQSVLVEAPNELIVLFEEMTLVQLLAEEYARVDTICAGVGLNNVAPSLEGPIILLPNAGDLSVDGSNVAIQLNPNGQIIFIPRVEGQRIRMPIDLGEKLVGHEVSSLTLDEARQLMAAGKIIWTAAGFGPYGNGHGLPGHIAECDPRYPGL